MKTFDQLIYDLTYRSYSWTPVAIPQSVRKLPYFKPSKVKVALFPFEYYDLTGNFGVYTPTKDTIRLLPSHHYSSQTYFECALYHETVHWTGHPSRLARRPLLDTYRSLVDEAHEELIANMATYLELEDQYSLCSIVRYSGQPEFSLNYLKNIYYNEVQQARAFIDAQHKEPYI